MLHPVDGASATFADSAIEADTVAAWRAAPGVDTVTPVGITQTRAEGPGASTAVALFGLDAGTAFAAPRRDDEVDLSAGAAKALGAAVGDDVSIAGSSYRVAAIGGDEWYSHTPVVALSTAAWTTLAQRLGGTGQPTVLAVTGSPAWDSVAADTGTTASTPLRVSRRCRRSGPRSVRSR